MNKEIKKGLVPVLRFSEFKDSGEWEEKTLGSFCKIGDIDHKMPLSVTDGIPYVMTGNFFGINNIDFDNAKKISIEDYEQLSRKIKPEYGDIIIARYASVGAVRYVETKIKFLVSYSCAIAKCSKSENSKYLYYVFQSDDIQTKIGLEINMSSQKNIGIDSIKKLNIFSPTFPEQTKIAACLSSLDDLITAQTQKIEALKTHKKGLMQQLFPQEGETVPKLRFPEFIDSGEWEEKTVGQISRNVTAGGTPSTSEKSYWGGNIKWMNSGELNNKKVYEVQGRITEEGLRNSSTKFIPKHSVLIGLAGQGKTRGTVAMNMVEVCINQSIAAIFPNDEKFFSNFLYHNLDNRYDELRRLSAGGEGRGGLNLQIIKSLIIHLPKLKEQTKIANCLSSLDDLINAQVKKCELLKTHKKGLMQGLFPSSNEEDYTKSRQNLDTSETIEEISKKAMMLRNHDQ